MSVEFCWTRTADHVRLAEIASHKSSCLAANFNQLQLQDPWAAANGSTTTSSRTGLLICSGQLQAADGDARSCSSGYDYRSLAFHINSWLDNLPADSKWNRSLVAVRIAGAAPDTLLADHLYQSIRRELVGQEKDCTTTADGHWTERIGCQLAKDTRLTIVLAGIDRLDSWGLMSLDKLPENVRLIVTCSSPLKDVRGWTTVHMSCPGGPPPSAWSSDAILASFTSSADTIDAILTPFFDNIENQYPADFVRKTCAVMNLASGMAGCNSSGLTEEEWRQCLESLSVGEILQQHLGQLIQSLDALLIRVDAHSASGGLTTPERGDEDRRLELPLSSAYTWSQPALSFARRRYKQSENLAASAFTAIPSALKCNENNSVVDASVAALRWLARFYSIVGETSIYLERDLFEETLFDWRTWRMAARAGRLGLSLISASVQQSSIRWIDSHLWLLERSLPWISQVDCNDCGVIALQQLASQLIVALKPYADKENSNNHLWRLYCDAQTECDQFSGPVLVSMPSGWNWNHSGKPLERKVDVFQREPIQLMTASPDGQCLVLVTADPIDPFFSLSSATGRRIAVYKGHSGRVTCVHVTGDGRHVISGSEDLSVIVWDFYSGNIALRIREHIASVSVVSSVVSSSLILTGGEDSIVMSFQWQPGKGQNSESRLARIDHHRGPITALAVNHRDDVLVSASQDGSICLWSLDDWTLLNLIEVGQPVGHVTLSRDDVFLLAVGLEDGFPRLFSLTTGSSLRTWTDLPIKVVGAVIVGGNGHSHAAVMAEDGRLMCYDCHSGQLIHALSIDYPGKSAAASSSCCTRTDDPRLFFHSVANKVKMWLLRYEEKRPVVAVTSPMTYLAMSPLDGASVATGDRSGQVQLWRASNLSKIAQWGHLSAPVSVVNFDAAGLYVASAAEDGTVAVWHLDAGQTLPATQIHPIGCRVNQLAIMADWNGYAVSCDSNETVIQWKLGTGEIMRQWNLAASKLLVVANNTRWMAGSTRSNSVRLWSLDLTEEHKEAVAVSHAEEVLCLTCTPDSRYLITGSKDSSLKMWDVLAGPTDKGGKLVQIMAGHGDHVTVVVAAHVANVPALANMANSKHLLVVSGSRDGQLIIWDAQHGCEIHSMRRHVSTVTCLKVTSDGSVVVSGSEDGTVRVWNMRLGTSLSSFALDCPVYQIVMSPDASRMWIRMAQKAIPAILDLRHTPAVLVKTEVASRPASPVHLKKAPPTRRLLKKEISLDSYTWLKRYGSKNGGSQQHHNQMAAHAQQMSVSPSATVESVLMKLSRRNSFCNVPESAET
ncbi:putative WD repeat-containing protein 18 [Daphnia magna]|uniref:Putative WD repeat-containing protein 18 n=1 Tax=Daphnia magna TaxID=35525 RepID=A0A164X1H5_9CRUS|nr:putative WD repeat-containing protein 18 [Daphnia magna]